MSVYFFLVSFKNNSRFLTGGIYLTQCEQNTYLSEMSKNFEQLKILQRKYYRVKGRLQMTRIVLWCNTVFLTLSPTR